MKLGLIDKENLQFKDMVEFGDRVLLDILDNGEGNSPSYVTTTVVRFNELKALSDTNLDKEGQDLNLPNLKARVKGITI